MVATVYAWGMWITPISSIHQKLFQISLLHREEIGNSKGHICGASRRTYKKKPDFGDIWIID